MQWIMMLMVVGMQVSAGEIKLWFDDGTEERPGCGYPRFIFGEKDVRRIDGSSVQNPVQKLKYVDFYTMMKAYVKMAGDRASVDVKFEQGLSANKVMEVMKELSKIGVKQVVFPHYAEEEVIKKVKVSSREKKIPKSPSSADTPLIVPVAEIIPFK